METKIILDYINNKDGWLTAKTIAVDLKMRYPQNITKKLKTLNRFGFIDLVENNSGRFFVKKKNGGKEKWK